MGSIFDMRDILQSRHLWRLSTTQCCTMTVAVTSIKMQSKNISSRSRLKRHSRVAGNRPILTTFWALHVLYTNSFERICKVINRFNVSCSMVVETAS